eukprot:m.119776 g.119776  ORF g.119776 m.119776 type:complete len:125 (-) comp15600_c0_seq1:753-1127(-)
MSCQHLDGLTNRSWFGFFRVTPDGPADKSGLRLGDRLWNVAEQYVRAWPAAEVRRLLHSCGNTVQLEVEPTLRKLQLPHSRQGYGFTLGQPQVSLRSQLVHDSWCRVDLVDLVLSCCCCCRWLG